MVRTFTVCIIVFIVAFIILQFDNIIGLILNYYIEVSVNVFSDVEHMYFPNVFFSIWYIFMMYYNNVILVGTRFSAHLDRPWGPPSLLYNGYQVFPGGKVWPGCAADHSPPSSAAVMEE